MDNRSVGSRGSLYPDLKGETASLDAPEALEVFSKGKVTGGRTRRSRARSPGPIGLQIDPTHMETFDQNDYCVGLCMDDGDEELLPPGAGGRASTESIDNSDSNGNLNFFDDSFVANNNSAGSLYGEVDLNDKDLKPAASPRKNPRSSNVARQNQQDADNRSEDGSRSARSTRSVHTNPGVLLNDKAQRTRKSAPKQTTAAERLAQFGATITRVRSAGSVHSAGAMHGHSRPTQTVNQDSGGPSKNPSQMDDYNSQKNAVWGQPGNVGTTKMSKQSPSLKDGQAESGMHKQVTTFPFNAYTSMVDSHSLARNANVSDKSPATTRNSYTGHDKNSVHAAPSANPRAGVEPFLFGPRVAGVPPQINDSHQRPYLKPTPKPLDAHRVAPYVQSTSNKQTPVLGPQARTQQNESHIGTTRPHVGGTNMYNPGSALGPAPTKPVKMQSHIGIPASAHLEMIGRMESMAIPPIQTHASMMPSPQVVVPHLGQNEHDKFQNALKHLKSTPATSQAPRQPPGTQTAALKAPDAGLPFHRQPPMEQQWGDPVQLPRLDHATSQSVNERYPSNEQYSMPSPMKKEPKPTSTWGRSPLAGAVNLSKKGHSIIDNGTNNNINNRVQTHGLLDSFSPPPPTSAATKKNKVKNSETAGSQGHKPKKASSLGSISALVGGIRRGKHNENV